MRSNVAKLAIYLVAVAALLAFLFPAFGDYVRIDEPREWEPGDGVHLIVPDPLLYSHVEMTFNYAPADADTMTVSVGVRWRAGVALPELPLAFAGQAADLVSDCHPTEGLATTVAPRAARPGETAVVAAAGRPVRWFSLAIADPAADPEFADAIEEAFEVDFACSLRTREVWRRSSGKANLSSPPAEVLTLEPIGAGESRAVRRKVGVRHCVTVVYAERPGVVPVYLFPQRQRTEERDEVRWRNCKRNGFADPEDGDPTDTRETVRPVGDAKGRTAYGVPAPAVRVSVEDTARQDRLNRNLFLAGIGLGIVGNFLVEAFGLTLAIVAALARPASRGLRAGAVTLHHGLRRHGRRTAAHAARRLASLRRKLRGRRRPG